MNRLLINTLCALAATAAGASAALAGDPAAASRYFEDGLLRFERGETREAIIQLKNALQQDGRMLSAHVLLGKALLREGQYAAAEVAFRDARRLGVDIGEIAIPYGRLLLDLERPEELLEALPEDGLPRGVTVEVLGLRALALARVGRVAESLEILAKARALAPRSAEPMAIQAAILIDEGRSVEALALSRQAVALDPASAAAWNAQGSARHAQGELSGAIDDYAQALALQPDDIDVRVARAGLLVDLKRDVDAAAELEMLRTQAPGEPRAAYLRALVAERAGRVEDSRLALQEVRDLIAALPADWLQPRPQYLMLGALANHALASPVTASALLETLLRKRPGHAGARKLLASIQLDAGEPALALASVEPVLRSAPEDPTAQYLAGRAYLMLGRPDRALALLERAAQRISDPSVIKARGQSRLATGETGLGIEDIAQSFEAHPDDQGAGFLLATLYARQGENVQALALMEDLVSRHPRSAAAWNMLGAIAAASDHAERARQAYVRAIQLAPEMTPPRLNLVRLDIAEGKLDEARKAVSALMKARPGDANILYELARVDIAQRRPDDAVEVLKRALISAPDDFRVAELLARLHLEGRRTVDALVVARDIALRIPDDFDVLGFLAGVQMLAGEREAAARTYRDMTRLADFDLGRQIRVGWLNLAAGEVAAARYNLSQAEARAPDDPATIELAGSVAVARQDWKEADRQLARLRKVSGGESVALRLGFEIARARGDRVQEIATAKALFDRRPDLTTLGVFADALLRAGNGTQAARLMDDWIAAHPDDVSVRVARAELAMRLGDWTTARHSWESLLGALPEHAGVLNNLAISHAALGQLGEALSSARRAHALDAQDPLVLDTLGWMLVLNHELEGGLRYLRDAKLRLPDNAEVRWHLGFALAKLGRAREAEVELRAALERSADFHGADEAKSLLVSIVE